jgi:hypothetical protein
MSDDIVGKPSGTIYRVIQRSSGDVIFESADRTAASDYLRELVAGGRPWDEFDLVEVGRRTRSLLAQTHESLTRSLIADVRGRPYRAFRTLAEARSNPRGAVILDGDYGGQIFATSPARLVRCTEARLQHLAEELEVTLWNSTRAFSASVVYEEAPPGSHISGGMGGGRVEDGVWVHEEIHQIGWAARVEGILLGRFDSLGPPAPDVPPEVRAGIARAYSEQVDVFCHALGFPCPDALRKVPASEWRRREDEVVPPPPSGRWFASTYRAIVAEEIEAGRLSVHPPKRTPDIGQR